MAEPGGPGTNTASLHAREHDDGRERTAAIMTGLGRDLGAASRLRRLHHLSVDNHAHGPRCYRFCHVGWVTAKCR